MTKPLALIRYHWGVMVLALIIGVLTVAPQLVATKLVPNFQGVYKMVSNDEIYYLARGQEVINGHPGLANPYLFEHKNGLPMQLWLPDFLLAKPLALLDIKIHDGYLFYDFVLPLVLTLLSYAILWLLTRSRAVSFLSTAFLHLNLFLYAFNRSPSPQLNFIFWLLLALVWLKFLERETWWRAGMMGLVFGLLFYIYPYYWTYYVVFYVLFLVLCLIFRQPLPYKKYALSFLVAGVVAIPYFVLMIKSTALPDYHETLARIGMISTHFPSGRKMVMWGGLTLLAVLIAYWRAGWSRDRHFFWWVSAILSTIAVVNQHVITGQNLQFSSHYWQLSVFVYIFALAYLVARWRPQIMWPLGRWLVVVGVVGFVLFSPARYVMYLLSDDGWHYTPREISQQRYAPVFDWLNQHTAPDTVVFADNDLSVLIPIYTANNVFFQALAGLHFMPNQEVWERFILNNFWEHFDVDYAVKEHFSIWGAYYPTLYDHQQSKNKIRQWFGQPVVEYVKYPQAVMGEFLTLSRKIQSQDFASQVKKYRVDYVIWDQESDPRWKLSQWPGLRPVFTSGRLIIYEVTPHYPET